MKRTQIYLDERQSGELSRRAAARGTTASKMIREAIDQYLAEREDDATRLARYRSAVQASFGIAPHLPDGATFVEELRRADRVRDAESAKRGRG